MRVENGDSSIHKENIGTDSTIEPAHPEVCQVGLGAVGVGQPLLETRLLALEQADGLQQLVLDAAQVDQLCVVEPAGAEKGW